MTERERLIELILRCDKEAEILDCYEERPKKSQAAEILADHLLANGVIVPPCKVGDKVYLINTFYSGFREAEVKAVYYTEDKKYYPKSHVIIQYDMARGRVRVNFTDFGKTVFLSREEVEKTLAERRKGK